MKKASKHKASGSKKQPTRKSGISLKVEKTPEPRKGTKKDEFIRLLNQPSGASLNDLMEATGWQVHLVRGFISGILKKRLGLNVVRDTASDGLRRYRIVETA